MDSSRRAVESYWRSRMIDGVTSDEDKVAPVYKLEEVCELLRSSHVSIVKEVSEFILKRLEHKSPIVKQKALRLIKYAVGKSGVEFRREMQRHSVAVRQLFHYKGQLDPLKGDALNKAVRDTAQETISVIFSSEDNKPAPAEDIKKRIQGFGSTSYEMPSEDKKSFLSEVVGLGSASIKHGLSSLTQGHSTKKNDNGSYKSPNLRHSLTTETGYQDRYEPANENQSNFGSSKNVASGPWNQDSRTNKTEIASGVTSSSYTETKNKTREERLVETIVTSGGVRLQPTRDTIQVFLVEAAKLDAVALSLALESKLQSPMWQVRMKAACVLESILRKPDYEHFPIVATFFGENIDVLVRCSESPQASLREKANKVLSLLGTEQGNNLVTNPEKPENASSINVQLPDLIDTDGPSHDFGADSSLEMQSDQNIANPIMSATPLINDLFGDGVVASLGIEEQKKDDDPFADVSFLPPNGDKEQSNDLIAGLTVDKQDAEFNHMAKNKSGPELFDVFGSNSASPQEHDTDKNDVNDLMAGFTINEEASKMTQKGISSGAPIFAVSSADPILGGSNNGLNGLFGSQATGVNTDVMFTTGALPYNVPSGFMYNPVFPAQPMNYNMGNFLAQQQLLATMSNFQPLGNLNNQNVGISHVSGTNGGYNSALPDIFQPSVGTQVPSVGMNNLKKEDTKAFDFISTALQDHLASARDPKRVA